MTDQPTKKGVKNATAAAGVVAAVSMLVTFEGWRPIGYLDIVGVATRCFGDTGPDVVVGKVYDKAFCQTQLAKRVLGFSNQIRACIDVDVPVSSFGGFLSWTYNEGAGNFCKYIAPQLNTFGLAAACRALNTNPANGRPRWVYAGRPLRYVKGLDDRRKKERAKCEEGLNGIPA